MTRSRSPPSPASHRCPTPAGGSARRSPRSDGLRDHGPPRSPDLRHGRCGTALWTAHRSAPCRRTRDHLAVHYRPLVRMVAHRTAERLPAHVEPADLVQSGVFGLLEAIDRFDPDRCPRFESYAVPRIRGAVLDELRAQDWVPRTVRLRAREAERVREQLAVRLRRTATEREVADALRAAAARARRRRGAHRCSASSSCGGQRTAASLDILAVRRARPGRRPAGAGDPAAAVVRGRAARRARPAGAAPVLPGGPHPRRDRPDARRHRVAGQPAARPARGARLRARLAGSSAR